MKPLRMREGSKSSTVGFDVTLIEFLHPVATAEMHSGARPAQNSSHALHTHSTSRATTNPCMYFIPAVYHVQHINYENSLYPLVTWGRRTSFEVQTMCSSRTIFLSAGGVVSEAFSGRAYQSIPAQCNIGSQRYTA